MNLEYVTNGLRDRIKGDSGLGATVKFDFGADGVIYVDGTAIPNTVTNENKDAECTIAIKLEDFIAMTTGDLDPTTAFMMGKLKVDGSMGIAMKLQGVLG